MLSVDHSHNKLRSIYSIISIESQNNGSQQCFGLGLLPPPYTQLHYVEVPRGQSRLGGPIVLLLMVADLIWSRAP